ncbi:MAG: flagellar assembly protein FliW [Clostridia bacterium]|nr:flagellar assembly protein FliW [Clostridia bacterium]
MLLKTKHFGEIEIEEGRILKFEEGVPGFEQVKKYVIVQPPDQNALFKWLQGVDKTDIAFVIVNPFSIVKNYDIEIKNDVIQLLEIEKEEDVEIYSIVVVPEDVSRMSMNLKAPIVINIKNNRGVQVVLDTDKYGVRHYILEELRRQEGADNVGSDKEEKPVDNAK